MLPSPSERGGISWECRKRKIGVFFQGIWLRPCMGWNPLVHLVHKDQRCFPLQRLKKAEGGIAKFPSVPTVWHLPSWCFRRVLHLMLWLWGTFPTVSSWWLSAGHGKGEKRKKGKILSLNISLSWMPWYCLPARTWSKRSYLPCADFLQIFWGIFGSFFRFFAAGQETDIKNSRVQGGVRKRGDPTRLKELRKESWLWG